jgi:membrane peptidoglycan carboxypeptidase
MSIRFRPSAQIRGSVARTKTTIEEIWAERLPLFTRIVMWPIALVIVIVLTAGLVAVGVWPVFGTAGYTVKVFDHTFLPNANVPLQLPKLPQRSTVYASDGSRLATVWKYNRKVVPLDKIAPVARQAVLAIEDHGFYEHGPLDLASIMRAFVANLRAHEIVQGGSTIAQQLIKNTETGNAVTLSRKLKEAQDAIRLEHSYSKDEILSDYLNQVPLGNGVYGIGTAAEYYFGKPASRLDLPESALLAGMIQGPALLDPRRHRHAAIERRNEVLFRMDQLGWITAAQYEQAIKASIHLSHKHRNVVDQPMWMQYVTTEFLNNPRFGKSRKDRRQLLYQGGLKIYTTLNPKWQDAAERAIVASHMTGPNMPQQALASIVPQTGAIRAMQNGNYPWSSHKYNLTTDPGGGRSAGSAFKAYTLATALEQGISPNAVYNGTSPKTIPNCGGGATWTVNNAEPGSGNYTLRAATAASVNVVFAQVINQVGPDNVARVAHKMGIESSLSPNVCPMTLGATRLGVNPLEMASGDATLANGGVHCQPYSIAKISGPSGKTIFRQKVKCEEAIPAGVAYLETQLLEGVITGGTGTSARFCCRPMAGKTGTGENFQDAWFCGYVRQLATAVWVGYARGEIPMRAVPGYGEGFGGTLAAPIWRRYMMAATSGMPVEQFPFATPPAPKLAHVPSVIGKTQATATAILTQAKFGTIVITGPSDQPAGIVSKQSPSAGASAPLGSAVRIYVSNGQKPPPKQVTVPNVVGKARDLARSIIQGAGLVTNVQVEHVSDPAQDGIVIAQSPGGGVKVNPGATVTIVVGRFNGSPSPAPPAAPLWSLKLRAGL